MANQKKRNGGKGLLKKVGNKVTKILFNAEESSKLKKVTLQLLTSLLIITAVGSFVVFSIIKTPASEIHTAYESLAQESATYSRMTDEEEKAAQQTKVTEAGELYNAVMQRYENSDMALYREYAKISVNESAVNSMYIYLLIPFIGLIVMLLTSGIQKFVARVNVTLLVTFLIIISPLILLVYMMKSTIVSLYNSRKNKPSRKHQRLEEATN